MNTDEESTQKGRKVCIDFKKGGNEEEMFKVHSLIIHKSHRKKEIRHFHPEKMRKSLQAGSKIR